MPQSADRHRAGGPGPAAGADPGGDPALRPHAAAACRWPTRSELDAQERPHPAEDLRPAPGAHRPRLQPLQALHDPAPHPAADAARSRSRSSPAYLELLREERRRGARPRGRPADHRHQLLPRPGGLRAARGGGDPRALRRARGRRTACGCGAWAAPRARRRTRWPSCSWRRRPAGRSRRRSRSSPRPARALAGAGARGLLSRRHRDRRDAERAAPLLPRRRTAATGSGRRCASWWSSRRTTCWATRPSRSWT